MLLNGEVKRKSLLKKEWVTISHVRSNLNVKIKMSPTN